MTYDEAYSMLELRGEQNIRFLTAGGSHVTVRASKLTRGQFKGDRVIRVQWAESTSILNSGAWDQSDIPLVRQLVKAVKSHLSGL